jgi:hypothetical protein
VTYVPPSFKGTAFNCPLCGAYAQMRWELLYSQDFRGATRPSVFFAATCSHCNKPSCWRAQSQGSELSPASIGRMIDPVVNTAPPPHSEMPSEIAEDYREAMAVVNESPRAAAALLRLAIQKLCRVLGEPGKNINDDIGALVKKGLPVEVQRALDIVRVIGNNAVHPGAIAPDDVARVCTSLFDLVNHIVEDQVARPKKLASMFAALPEPAKAGIEARDK